MFKQRSYTKELLDADNIPDGDLICNLKELDTINHLLGGYAISFAAIKKVLQKDRQYVIVDIGCGGGDTVKRMNKWSNENGFDTKLYGVDLKSVCIDYAIRNNQGINGVDFICDDYRNAGVHVPHIDILHACLFCHHLSEEEIIGLIRFAAGNRITLIINDLERNPIAYYSIKILTGLFSKSYLVKNDAPLSVWRGFKKREWLAMLKQAGAHRYTVRNKWAFRHEVIVYND
jgi:SAM-dependent methyltransferase